MPCYHAKPAWQAKLGSPLSFTYVKGWRVIMVPCTTCIGCIKAHAKAWALRCHYEATQHLHNSFATLTFSEAHVPFSLDWRRDGQTFLKSLRQRADRPFRFFASGEYGTKGTHRPHYHFLLFGFGPVGAERQKMVETSWGKGNCQLVPVTARRIAYTAGYTDKKAADKFHSVAHCDPDTGEIWQPPFIQMSRGGRTGHGIGGHVRKHTESWRLFAIHQENKQPVPRYYHKAWRDTATPEDLQQLQEERDKYNTNRDNRNYLAQMKAAEAIAIKQQERSREQRQI